MEKVESALQEGKLDGEQGRQLQRRDVLNLVDDEVKVVLLHEPAVRLNEGD